MNFFITLRGTELEIEGEISRAEPDVGIMSDYMDEFEVKSPEFAKDWDFTDAEIELIDKAARQAQADDLMEED